MSVILLDKNKFNILLKEDVTSGKYNPLNPYNQLSRDSDVDPTKITKNLGGDDAGSAEARSEYLRSKIQKNFSSLGIYSDLQEYMESQGIFTLELIQQYTQPFDFSFVKEDGEKFSGKAIYNKQLSEKFKTLVLDFNEAKLKFTPESLKRPFLAKKGMWGKYKDKMALMGLQTNGIFDVEIAGNLSSKSEETEEESNSDYKVGDEISFQTDKGKKGKGKIVKIEGDDITVTDGKGNEIVISKKNVIKGDEQGLKKVDKEVLFNDIASLFKFVYNNRKLKSENINYYIDEIAGTVKLITEEEEKGSIEKIKILKVGIFQELKKGEEEGGKKGKPMIKDKNFTKCKAELKFETSEDDTIFNKSTKKEIVDGLNTGKFFVRMTQRPKAGLVLIFSKTENESGSFFTLAGKNIKSPKDPSQWKGEVMVGDKAMGNKDFKGTKAFIKNLVLSK